MSSPNKPSNKLLVEGKDDRAAIAFLAEKNGIAWGDEESGYLIDVVPYGSLEDILRDDALSAHLSAHIKERRVQRLGIIIDADDDFDSRWKKIRTQCIHIAPSLPEPFPHEGIVSVAENGKRFGIWIMPDNRSRGMMETFLSFLLPEGSEAIWDHATSSVSQAKIRGAACRECHNDKANMFTYLAWGDPPGQTFGTAIAKSILNGTSEKARPFLMWFKKLYEL